MPYGLILLVVSFVLTGRFVFMADVPLWSKALFLGLLLVSLVWSYGGYVQLGVSLCLAVYFRFLKVRDSP